MRLGGMVASGGPYAVAHPAPEWIWIMPVSAILMVATLLVGFLSALSDPPGPRLLILAWPALFTALGWNFLEFGMGWAGGTGISGSWLVCAGLFGCMGLIPLIFVFKRLRVRFREEGGGLTARWYGSLCCQMVVAGAAIWCGTTLFERLVR